MPRHAMPTLARMIADQTRPADGPENEHETVVQTAEASNAEAYGCLY
jgi:hypothetical protein